MFIGGPPRSGTTLMQRIMGAHSEVFAGPEFDFIPTEIVNLRRKMLASIQSGRIESIVDIDDLDEAFRSFVGEIFDRRLTHAHKSFFSEKTPANALVFSDLEEVFPDARFIMMVRNPCDIVNSMKVVRDKFISNRERPPRFVRSIAASIREINRYYYAGFASCEKSKNVLLVYFEDLVENPLPEVRKVCNHVGLTYENDMVRIESKDSSIFKSDDEKWYSHADFNQPIQSAGVVSKRQALSEADISLVERFVIRDPALDRYDLSKRKPNWRDMVHWRISLARKACVFCPR